jgi:hypothetical protein
MTDRDFALALRCAGECLGAFELLGTAEQDLLQIVYQRLQRRNGRPAMYELVGITRALLTSGVRSKMANSSTTWRAFVMDCGLDC